MKMMINKCLRILSQAWLWSLVLLLCVIALLWWGGPRLAIDESRPWASVSARLVTAGALLLLWGAAMLLAGWSKRRAAGQDPVRQAELLRQGDERKALRLGFAAAMRALTTCGLSRAAARRQPCYLLIGPPGSGKTRLLACSGLEFPLHSFDLAAERTADQCEWYVTDQALLIDVPSRYLTQLDAGVDAHGWKTLLRLLRQRRRARPLNGVLLSVPVPMLLQGGQQAMQALRLQLRQRLDEIRRILGAQVPVYLVLSKADQLPGFTAFFSSLSREQQQQVLGASLASPRMATDPHQVRQQVQALLAHLDSQLLGRLHHDRDVRRRSLMLEFAQQMAVLGERLCSFIDGVFTPGRMGAVHGLRGFYLTSAAVPTLGDEERDGTMEFHPERHAPSRSLFIHDLFARVMFAEAALAGLEPGEQRRIRWTQRAVLSTGLAALVVGGLLWTQGFALNHQRLESLRQLANDGALHRQLLTPDADSQTTLKLLDNHWQATQVFPASEALAWHERNGLYQGGVTRPVVVAAYHAELQTQLLPQVSRLLETRIRASLHDRDALLDNLRAYLMLNLPARRDPAWLAQRLDEEWGRIYPAQPQVQEGLNRHFGALLQVPFSQPLDEKLVSQARQVLRGESLASLAYKVLREQARGLPEYRLGQHLGAQRELFVGAEHGIPGLYTRQGYRQLFSVHSATQVSELLRDNWILGGGSELSARQMRQLLTELEQLYFRDYARYWSEAVGRLGLLPFNDAGEGADLANGLLSAHSPVVQMLVQIRDNTRFAPAQEADSSPQPEAGLAALAQTGKALATPDNARKTLQRRFEPLHRLLDEDDSPVPELAGVLQALDAVQQQLASLARTSQPEQLAYDMARARMGGQRDALSQLRNSAARLPRPAADWFAVLADDAWRLMLADAYRYLDQRYRNELHAFYAKALAQRYPFHAHASSDVALNDFREFFKPQGLLERFVERHLQPFVSGQPGNLRLRSVDGHGLPMSVAFLEQLGRAQRIREAFFAEDPAQPQIRFRLEPYGLDSAASRVEFRFGAARQEYRHGPIVPLPLTWPDAEGQGAASLLVERRGGRAVGIEKDVGPWSLFRLLDLLQSEPLSGRDVLLFKAELGGLRANYLLASQRMPSPFDMSALRGFRLPGQL